MLKPLRNSLTLLIDYIEKINTDLPKHEELGGDKKAIEKHFDDTFEVFKELRDYLATIIFCLPSYTQQTYQKTIDSLHITLNKEKDKALPKSKFSFGKKTKDKSKVKEKVEEVKHEQDDEETDVFELIDDTKDFVIKNQKGLRRIVKDSEYVGKDKVYLYNIDNCDIYLPFVMKALYVKNVTNSRIYAGYVMGASFFNSTNKCSYHVASHQIRIHKAYNTDFYLYAKQGPIVEDCSELRFGPYMFKYPDSVKHETYGGFFNVPNLYNKIKDFKWLKKEKSPNFSVLSEEEIQNLTYIVLEKSDLE